MDAGAQRGKAGRVMDRKDNNRDKGMGNSYKWCGSEGMWLVEPLVSEAPEDQDVVSLWEVVPVLAAGRKVFGGRSVCRDDWDLQVAWVSLSW